MLKRTFSSWRLFCAPKMCIWKYNSWFTHYIKTNIKAKHKNSHQRRWQIPRPKSNLYAVTSSQPSIYIWCDNTECNSKGEQAGAVLTWYICILNIIKISQMIWVIEHKSSFKWDNSKGCKGEQPFLHVTHRFHLIYMSTKDHKNISKGIKVIECTSFLL